MSSKLMLSLAAVRSQVQILPRNQFRWPHQYLRMGPVRSYVALPTRSFRGSLAHKQSK